MKSLRSASLADEVSIYSYQPLIAAIRVFIYMFSSGVTIQPETLAANPAGPCKYAKVEVEVEVEVE